jgi:hypothetical protein
MMEYKKRKKGSKRVSACSPYPTATEAGVSVPLVGGEKLDEIDLPVQGVLEAPQAFGAASMPDASHRQGVFVYASRLTLRFCR